MQKKSFTYRCHFAGLWLPDSDLAIEQLELTTQMGKRTTR